MSTHRLVPARRLAAIALTVGLVAGACGASGTTPAPSSVTPTTAPSGGASASPASGVDLLPAPETTSVTIGVTNNLAVGQFLDKFADDLGLFDKFGVDVEVVSFEGDGQATQAVVAGTVQGTESSGGLVIASQLGDTPLVATSLNNLRLDYVCIAGPEITTPDQLRGKTVGVSSLGSVAHAVVLACLQEMDLTPEDVTILAVGNESSRIAAVTSGAIDAAPVQIDRADQLVEQGLNVLVDLTSVDLQYATAGLGFRKDWLAENRNTAIRLLAALLVAQETMWADPESAVASYTAFNGSDEETARAAINTYVNGGGNRGLRFTRDAFILPQQVTGSVNPDVLTVDIDTAYDLSLLDELATLGFDPAAEVGR